MDDSDFIELNGNVWNIYFAPIGRYGHKDLVSFKLNGYNAIFQDYSSNKDTVATYLKNGDIISIHITKKDTLLLTQNKSIKTYSLKSDRRTILTVENKLKQENFIHYILIPLTTILAIFFGVRMIKKR